MGYNLKTALAIIFAAVVFISIVAWQVIQWRECRGMGFSILYCIKHIS